MLFFIYLVFKQLQNGKKFRAVALQIFYNLHFFNYATET